MWLFKEIQSLHSMCRDAIKFPWIKDDTAPWNDPIIQKEIMRMLDAYHLMPLMVKLSDLLQVLLDRRPGSHADDRLCIPTESVGYPLLDEKMIGLDVVMDIFIRDTILWLDLDRNLDVLKVWRGWQS